MRTLLTALLRTLDRRRWLSFMSLIEQLPRHFSTDFSTHDSGELRFGSVDISIPRGHQLGNLERPSFYRFEFQADPARDVALIDVKTTTHLINASGRRRLAELLPYCQQTVHLGGTVVRS